MAKEPEEVWSGLLVEHIRPALMGRLVQGFIHNLSGPPQILSMQLEFLSFLRQKKKKLLEGVLLKGMDPDTREKLYQMLEGEDERLQNVVEQVERINQLLSAFSLKTNPDRTFIELNDFIREEIIFWEANLFFKHEVKKELSLFPSGVTVKTIYPLLRGAVDLVLCWIIDHGFDEEKVITFETRPDPSLVIAYKGTPIPQQTSVREVVRRGDPWPLYPVLAREIFQEIGNLEFKGNEAIFRFH